MARLGDQQAPGILLSLPPSPNQRMLALKTSIPAFTRMSGLWIQVLMLTQHILYT